MLRSALAVRKKPIELRTTGPFGFAQGRPSRVAVPTCASAQNLAALLWFLPR
jgi:hypothetical protein